MSALSPSQEPPGEPPWRPPEPGDSPRPAISTVWLPPGAPRHSRGDSALWRAAKILGLGALAVAVITVPVYLVNRDDPPTRADGDVVATPSSTFDAARTLPIAPTAPATPATSPTATPEPTPKPIVAPTTAPTTQLAAPDAPANGAPPAPPAGEPAVEAAPPAPPASASLTEQIVVLTNGWRSVNGLPALTVSSCATQQAAARTAVLVLEDRFEHDPLDPIIAACGSGTVGENLSLGYADAQSTVDGWMASDGHRANILNPAYTQIGVGCTDGPKGELCGQVFLG